MIYQRNQFTDSSFIIRLRCLWVLLLFATKQCCKNHSNSTVCNWCTTNMRTPYHLTWQGKHLPVPNLQSGMCQGFQIWKEWRATSDNLAGKNVSLAETWWTPAIVCTCSTEENMSRPDTRCSRSRKKHCAIGHFLARSDLSNRQTICINVKNFSQFTWWWKRAALGGLEIMTLNDSTVYNIHRSQQHSVGHSCEDRVHQNLQTATMCYIYSRSLVWHYTRKTAACKHLYKCRKSRINVIVYIVKQNNVVLCIQSICETAFWVTVFKPATLQ